MKIFEALTIRLLWVKYAFRLKRMPGLCPPQCREMHTYQFPCRARFTQRPWWLGKKVNNNPRYDTYIMRRQDGQDR